MNILQQEKFLYKKNTNTYITTVRLNHIEALHKYIQIKARDIESLARKFIPAGSGKVFLTTKGGILEHKAALKKNIGGAIIMFCY